jgi:hypothetical protein
MIKIEDGSSSVRNGWVRKMGEDVGTVDGIWLGQKGFRVQRSTFRVQAMLYVHCHIADGCSA